MAKAKNDQIDLTDSAVDNAAAAVRRLLSGRGSLEQARIAIAALQPGEAEIVALMTRLPAHKLDLIKNS